MLDHRCSRQEDCETCPIEELCNKTIFSHNLDLWLVYNKGKIDVLNIVIKNMIKYYPDVYKAFKPIFDELRKEFKQ